MYCSAQFGYLDQLQDDLRASRPELDIQILGMNPFQEESGNAAVTEGRDIPWLQDVDADGDNFGDTWLVDWPFVYRDVVIVDANGVAVDSYNLTINSLEEPESYSTLRQMLIDVAVSAIDGADDSVAVLSGATSEINVLANDVGSSRLSITDITMPEFGVAEIATIEYPATLDPVDRPITDLVISEIVPGEYIEIYNSSFTESVDLGAVSHVLVSGEFDVDIAALSSDDVPARGYRQMPWPAGLQMSGQSGELILYHSRESGFDEGSNMLDFVAWGEVSTHSRIELAREMKRWEGPPDGTLDVDAIQRIPGTIGNESHSYDNHRPSTPGNAINDAVETTQVIRYTPPASFVGEVELSYTVMDDAGVTDTARVRIDVAPNSLPWQNPENNYDVNNDGEITYADAQAVIDVLNAGFAGDLPTQMVMPLAPSPFVDCNGNNSVEPRDVLAIFHELLGTVDQASAEQRGAGSSSLKADEGAAGEPPEGVSESTMQLIAVDVAGQNSADNLAQWYAAQVRQADADDEGGEAAKRDTVSVAEMLSQSTPIASERPV